MAIPGYPLGLFLASSENNVADPAMLSTLHDADVILGRDSANGEEFVVFGRETLQRVAHGEDIAEGYNLLCIEISRRPGSPDLGLLLELVTSVKGENDFLNYGTQD
jgi:hypothetical protein